jgi:replicative DNA helicase
LKPIDILTVTEQLRVDGALDLIGGAYFVTQLTSKVGSAAHIDYHARIVAQKYIQRQMITLSAKIQGMAYDNATDIIDLLNTAESELFQISEGNVKKETNKIESIIQQAIAQIEESSKRTDGLSGAPSGFTALDRLTSGWQPSDLIIIAARPSMGKTAFVLSMMRNMAVEHKVPVVLFSLEMSNVQLINRLIVGETGLSSDKIKTGKLESYEWEQLDYKIKDLAAAPIFVDDTPALSVFEFRSKARRLKMQHGIRLIIIDYLQLMTIGGDVGSREQEVSMISRTLKGIAKELNVPVIALSQLNRSVEMRTGDKRPQLSDLRESGAIEQDADIVMFIHRPERYGLTEDAEGNSTRGLAELIVAKHRNGAVDTVKLKFIGEQAKFTDFEENFDVGMTYGSKMNDDFGGTTQTFNPGPATNDVPF